MWAGLSASSASRSSETVGTCSVSRSVVVGTAAIMITVATKVVQLIVLTRSPFFVVAEEEGQARSSTCYAKSTLQAWRATLQIILSSYCMGLYSPAPEPKPP